MLSCDDLDVFGAEQIMNAFHIANRQDWTSFVYQPNCQNMQTKVQLNCFVVKEEICQKNIFERDGQ